MGQIPRHRLVSVGVKEALGLALRTAGLLRAIALWVWINLAWAS